MRNPDELVREHEALARVLDDHAAVSLLQMDSADVLITVLANTFSTERDSIPAEVFEAEVESVLRTLHARGYATPKVREVQGDGRRVPDLCRDWVNADWLWRTEGDDGAVVYTRTAETHEAIAFLERLGDSRRGTAAAAVGELVASFERMSARVTGDTERQLEQIQHERERLDAREALLLAGEAGGVSVDEFERWYDEALNNQQRISLALRWMAQELPRARRALIEKVAGDDLDGITHITAYAEAWEDVTDTPQGRATKEALSVLSDSNQRQTLSLNVAAIAESDVGQLLNDREKRSLSDVSVALYTQIQPLIDVFNSNLDEVTYAFKRRAISSTDRSAWMNALRDAVAALRDAESRNIPLGALPFPVRSEMGQPPASFKVREPAAEPPSLDEMDTSTALPPDPELLARWAGPHRTEVAEHIAATLAALEPGEAMSLSELWGLSPESLRRAVELVPYVEHAHAVADVGESGYQPGSGEVIETLAPDGNLVRYQIARIIYRRPIIEAP